MSTIRPFAALRPPKAYAEQAEEQNIAPQVGAAGIEKRVYGIQHHVRQGYNSIPQESRRIWMYRFVIRNI